MLIFLLKNIPPYHGEGGIFSEQQEIQSWNYKEPVLAQRLLEKEGQNSEKRKCFLENDSLLSLYIPFCFYSKSIHFS